MMSSKLFLLASVLGTSVQASADASLVSDHADLKEMQKAHRSVATHTRSMEAMMKVMTVKKAWSVLEKHNLTTTALMDIKNALNGKQASLRRAAPAGYHGVERAHVMLNDMIYDAAKNYDDETAHCTFEYSRLCTLMEGCMSTIDSSNFEGAEAVKLIDESEERIARAKTEIPDTRDKLKEHNRVCKGELEKMDTHLKILDGDIEVMSDILDLTACADKTGGSAQVPPTTQANLLQCEDSCSKEMFIAFDSDEAQKKLEELRSPVSQKLLQEALKHEMGAAKSSKSVSFAQLHSDPAELETATPRKERPADPCSEEGAGAPRSAKRRANKCTLTPGSCTLLTEKFLAIQSGIGDERTNLVNTISDFGKYCDDLKGTMEETIEADEQMMEKAEISLADGTGKKAQANTLASTTAAEHETLVSQLEKELESCNENYIALEGEMCALRKIRGELYKMKGSGHSQMSASFQDCEVGPWEETKCSKLCGGGEQDLKREMMSAANGGAKCLPLTEERRCNLQECPVDCLLEEWAGWSKCTAECGGGVQNRLREVRQAMKHKGKPCDVTTDQRSCNVQSCVKDCVLGSWTKWSPCSKDCGGGTNKRVKYVISPAEGQGKCADQWSRHRLQYKMCHTQECPRNLTCDRELDVALLLDGSGSLGPEGWAAELKAAKTFVNAFDVPDGKARISVTLYSGPSYTRGKFGVKACLKGAKAVEGTANMEKYCKIRTVASMEDDKSSNMAAVKNEISKLESLPDMPRGSTLTSLALFRAKSEIDMSPRRDAPSVVVVFTDGKPYNLYRTWRASKTVRKTARLVWVLVGQYAPLKLFKWFASRRWQENVVIVEDFSKLANPSGIVDELMADICPAQHIELA